MAITYTTNLSLAKPPEGHTDWADDINANWDTLDAESIKYLLLDGTRPMTGSITLADDTWIGLGAAKGRIVFDDTTSPDEIHIEDATLDFGANAITGTGTVDADGLTIGATSGGTITDIKDEDDMASDSQVFLATQQSIKAYVDTGDTAIYAQLSDSTDQTFASEDTAYSITFDTNDEISGITHSEGSENITIVTSGVYSIIAQPQVATGAGGAGYFHMWLEKDPDGEGFDDVANSNIELTLASQEENVIPLIVVIDLTAGDIIRLQASVGDTAIKLDAQTPPNEPAIPSIIFSMYCVGK